VFNFSGTSRTRRAQENYQKHLVVDEVNGAATNGGGGGGDGGGGGGGEAAYR
jgi:hypothetical protein